MIGRLRKEWLAVILLTFLGTGMRLYNLGGQGIWWDEMFTLLMASGQAGSQLGPFYGHGYEGDAMVLNGKAFRDALAKTPSVQPAVVIEDVYRYEPSHPPLHYVIANLSLAVFGVSDFSLRLPSALFGALTIPFLFLVGRRLYNAETGLIAAAFFAFAPYEVYYGQEARMYSLLVFLAVASTWFLVRISYDGQGDLRGSGLAVWSGYVATSTVGLYTHFLFVFMLGIHFLLVLERHRRDGVFLRRWFLAMGVCFLVFLPLLFARLFNTNPPPSGLGWFSGQWPFSRLIRAVLDNILGFAWVEEIRPYKFLWLLVGLFFVGLLVLRRQRARWLLFWFVVPPAVVLIIDLMLGTHASSVGRYYILASPALYLILAQGIAAIRPLMLSRGIAGAVVLYLAIGAYWTAEGKIHPRIDFKSAGQWIAEKSRPEDLLIMVTPFPNRVRAMHLAYYTTRPERIIMLRANDPGGIDLARWAGDGKPDQQLTLVVTEMRDWDPKRFDPTSLNGKASFLKFEEARSYRGLSVFRYRWEESAGPRMNLKNRK